MYEIVNKIRNAIFGDEVRSSIADGIETVYNKQEEAINVANNAYERTSQIIAQSGTSSTETIDARKGKPTLRDKIDEMDSYISTTLRGTQPPLDITLPTDCYIYIQTTSQNPLWVKSDIGWQNIIGIYYNPKL